MNSTNDHNNPITQEHHFRGASLFCEAHTVQELTGTPYEWLLERAATKPAAPAAWLKPPWAMLLLKLEQLQVSQEEHAGKHVTLPKVLDTMGTVPGMLKALKNHTIPCAPQDLASIPPHMLTPILEHILKTSSPQVVRYWDTVVSCEYGNTPGFLGPIISSKCSCVLGNILNTRPTGAQGKQWYVYTPHTGDVSTMGLDELTCFPQSNGSVPVAKSLRNFGLWQRLEIIGAVVADTILSAGGPGVSQGLLAQAEHDEQIREKLVYGLRLFHEAHQLTYKHQWLINNKNLKYDELLQWMLGRLQQLYPDYGLIPDSGVRSFIVAATSSITPGGEVTLDEGRVHGFMRVVSGLVSETGVSVTPELLLRVYDAARGVYRFDDAVDWGFLESVPAPMVAAMLGITPR